MSEEQTESAFEAGPDATGDPPAADALAGQVTRAVRDLQLATAEARLALARRLHLSVNDVSAMDHLLGAEPMGPVELGNRLGIRSASATVMADRLQKSGHLRRVPHPSDRRRQTLQPTAQARSDVLKALSPMLIDLQSLASGLTGEEARVVLKFLQDATAVLTAYADLDTGTT